MLCDKCLPLPNQPARGQTGKYYVPAKDTHLPFFVVDAEHQRSKQPQYKTAPQNKDCKRMDLFGHKVYSSAILQFRVANSNALLAIDHDNYSKLNEFTNYLPE